MLLCGQFTLKKSNNARLKRKQKVTEFALAWKRPQTLAAFATVPCDRPSPARGWWIIIKAIWAYAHDLTKMCTSKNILFLKPKKEKN